MRRNEREAVVEHHPLYTLSSDQTMTLIGGDYRILSFWRASGSQDEEVDAFISELEHLRLERMQEGAKADAPETAKSGSAKRSSSSKKARQAL